MNYKSFVPQLMLTIVVAALVAAVVGSWITFPHTGLSSATQSSTLASRVVQSGEIRCGYVTYPPGCILDSESGRVKGVFVELLEEAAQNLGLKVKWTEEVGWGSMIEGLRSGRYDMIGSPVWANATRAKLADFSTPLFYSGICAYARPDDMRFRNSLEVANASTIRIATIDGEMSAIIAKSRFPKAETVSLPQLSDNSQMLLNVAQGHADITFVEPYIANMFLSTHLESLVNLTPVHPVMVFPNTMMFGQGEFEFKEMLDVALNELIRSGKVQLLFEKYAVPAGSFYLPAQPYSPGDNSSP